MSRHDQTVLDVSPSQRAFFWHGKDGKLSSPIEGEGGGWETIEPPFSFALIDGRGFTITGKENLNSDRRVKSNIAHPAYSTVLKVEWKDNGAVIAEGQWKGIKSSVQAVSRGRWTANVFILFNSGGEYQVGTLMLHGRAAAAWLKFFRDNKDVVTRNVITISGTETVKGDTDSEIPVFKVGKELPDSFNEKADAAYKELHEYLTKYFQSDAKSEMEQVEEQINGEVEKAVNATEAAKEEPETVDDDDLPF